MTLPTQGELAPNFALTNQNNKIVELKSFIGKSRVVVYFYPKASTPGCTLQACGIRDYSAEFKRLNTVVLGISPDAPSKLQRFDLKYQLNFDLLSDQDCAIADAFGARGLKKFMGREYIGIHRMSFIINLSGHIEKIIEKVNTKSHNDQLIASIEAIM